MVVLLFNLLIFILNKTRHFLERKGKKNKLSSRFREFRISKKFQNTNFATSFQNFDPSLIIIYESEKIWQRGERVWEINAFLQSKETLRTFLQLWYFSRKRQNEIRKRKKKKKRNSIFIEIIFQRRHLRATLISLYKIRSPERPSTPR